MGELIKLCGNARNAEDEGRKKEGKGRLVGVWIAEIVFLIDIKQRKRFNKKRDPERADCLKDSRPSVLSIF